jgi:hypothetical protein
MDEAPKSFKPDISPKRNLIQIAVIATVLLGIGIVWWMISRVNPSVRPPLEVLTKKQPISLKNTWTIAPNKLLEVPLTIPG